MTKLSLIPLRPSIYIKTDFKFLKYIFLKYIISAFNSINKSYFDDFLVL